ncbi:hypothetical protein D9Q98_008413 [Chlorella vulgaris]|uniref:RRM domain-containing protein n=1 Tax=Chlorella vulgaris TaxID=3077 RepID=A0A9D4YTJ1_CHLVU|nr:hypothetical protein D9Q98_008413 [Chlorella vulgaris]
MPKRKATQAPEPAAAEKLELPVAAEAPSTSGGEPSKVVYLGHIPHGFYEKELKEYFSQFGRVTKLRLSRSKKSGKSKHYGFLEFASAEVAQIAAHAMDGYMLFTQKLTARVMAKEEVHADLFKGANRVFKKMPWVKIERERHNRDRTPAEVEKRARQAVERDQRRQQRIAAAGIDYSYVGLEASVPQKSQKTRFKD